MQLTDPQLGDPTKTGNTTHTHAPFNNFAIHHLTLLHPSLLKRRSFGRGSGWSDGRATQRDNRGGETHQELRHDENGPLLQAQDRTRGQLAALLLLLML